MAAPTLNTSLPHTPAKEWASITKDAINDKANPILETQNSTVSTPGPYFPGAYPRSADKNAPDASETLPSTEQVKGVVDAVTGTALAYLPSREDTVGLLEKAKEYLPAAVQGYFPNTSSESQETHPTSLPSQEVHGDTSGKSDGVGALPGELDEAGVAKLPDERSSSEKLPLDPHPILTTTNTLNDPPEALKARTHAVTAKDNRIEDLPVENAEGSPVSTLPKAPVRELGNAAVLQSPSSHHPGSHAVTAKDKDIVDSPLSKEGSNPVTTLPNAPVSELPGPTPAPKEPSTLPTNYGHMVNQQPPPSPSKVSPTAGMAKKQESSPISPSSSISARSSEKTKASLLDKVKGEAKVITGKLSHNEEKVLEGKKLMGKTPST